MHTGAGEWIWLPLSNPVKPSVSVFLDANPRGFEASRQRDRNFSDYEDASTSPTKAQAELLDRAARRLGRGRGWN